MSIIFQILEQKYLNSALDCIAENVAIQSGTLSKELGADYKKVRDTHKLIFEQMPQCMNATIIAVDTSKDNFVCGIAMGFEFYEYIDMLRVPSSSTKDEFTKKLHLKLFEPLLRMNYQPGELIYGSKFGVRSGYENQHIGQVITLKFIENASFLGYSQVIGAAYNPKSAYIFQKLGSNLIHHFKINEDPDLDDNIKQNLKFKDMFVFGEIINHDRYGKYSTVQEAPRL